MLTKVTKVPSIEVSRARDKIGSSAIESADYLEEGPDRDARMAMPREGGDQTKPVATTSSATPDGPTGPRLHQQQSLERSNEGDSLDLMTHDQRRAILEQLAQRLVDDALDDAFELYLRRELQQTAEETVREALAAAGAGEF